MDENYMIAEFQEKITALADTPNVSAGELKRRLQAPAEELRVAHNALAACVKGITDATYPKTVSEGMLTAELAGKINGKAEQGALEAVEEATADSFAAIQTSLAAKSEVYIGTYTGNNTKPRNIDLGFRPKAVIITDSLSRFRDGNFVYGGIALDDCPASSIFVITDTGFQIKSAGGDFEYTNSKGTNYYFIAFK